MIVKVKRCELKTGERKDGTPFTGTSVVVLLNKESAAQLFIPEDVTSSSWIGVDSTDMERSTEVICGYCVELIYNDSQYIAVWTDNLYIYTIDFVNYNVDPRETVTSMIASIVDVSTIEPLG